MSLAHRVGAFLRRHRVGLWYHPDYNARSIGGTSRVEHVELDRGERIIARLFQEGLLRPVDVRTPPIASMGQLRRFHGLAYLERAGEPESLAHVFGLEPEHIDSDSLLAFARRTTGGTISGLNEAAAGRLDVAVNLGGGFHHAEPEQGSGFCIVNDVGVAIADLRATGWRGRVAIVDLDFHQGNGNTVAYAHDPSVFVYSIHGAVWTHVDSGGKEIHLTGPVNDRRYLAVLRTTLETSLRRFRPDVVVYIAGADVLAGDRLGSFWLTLKGTFDRDQHVYEVVRRMGLPLLVTLAGGYGPFAWLSDLQLVRALLSGVWLFERRASPSLRSRYMHIAAGLDPRELQREPSEDLHLTTDDLFDALGPRGASERFLDFYSRHGMEFVFERYGILESIRKRGYEDIEMELEPARQLIRIRGRKEPSKDMVILLELVPRRMYIPSPIDEIERLEVIFIEWLLLQDPSRSFSLARPPLPGQDHPGLGLARPIQEILVQASRRLGLAGVMDRPSHYHSALLCESEWRFLDPAIEGRFRAMRAVLAEREFYEATRLVEDGRLALESGETVSWIAGDHLLPVDPRVRSFLDTERFLRPVRDEKARLLDAGLHVVSAQEALLARPISDSAERQRESGTDAIARSRGEKIEKPDEISAEATAVEEASHLPWPPNL